MRHMPVPLTSLQRRCIVNWNGNLSEALNCQIKNNMLDIEQLGAQCETMDFDTLTSYYNVEPFDVYHEYELTLSEAEIPCKKLLQRISGYMDVISRDSDVFNQRNWNVITHAIIVLYKGQYFGHIYALISPIDPTICCVQGIRNRVDSVFIKDSLRDIAHYLFEGVRAFALSNGCNKIAVVSPLPIMRRILTNWGFRPKTVDGKVIGKSVANITNSPFVILSAMILDKLDRSFVDPSIQLDIQLR